MSMLPSGSGSGASAGGGDRTNPLVTGGAPGAPRSAARMRTSIKPPPPGLCKKLTFPVTPEQDLAVKEAMQMMSAKVQIDHDVEIANRAQQKEAHEQRLKELRGLLKEIEKDDWMYPSPDHLLGLK